MKRYAWVFLAALIVVAASVSLSQAAFGPREPNSFFGQVRPLAVTLGAATRGVVFQTAAINSDGSIASCFGCVGSHTMHLSTGDYQVGFSQGNITATHGWSRMVQVDTLTTGAISGVSCTTADRAGDVTAIFVQCTSGGSNVDTSFFLFLAR
jgi:hypothetical protein